MSLLDKITNASLNYQRLMKNIDQTQRAPYLARVDAPKRIKPDKLTSRITSYDLNDQELLLQNQKIGIANRKIRQTPKIMTKLENEIVEDFQAGIQEGFKTIDPLTGGEIFRKYNLTGVEPPDLDRDPSGVVNEFIDEIIPESHLEKTLRELERIRLLQLGDYQELLDEKQRLEVYLEYLTNILNTGETTSNEREELRNEIAQVEFEIEIIKQDATARANEVSVEYESIKKEIFDEYKEHNRLVKEKKDRNLERIKQYQVQLNTMNSGAFNTSKMENESEDEYLERLRRNAEETLPEELLEQANSKILQEFRKKLKDITSNPVKIDQVSNSFNPEDKFQLIKIWKLVKEKYNKTYGLDNKSIEPETIVSFFEALIAKKQEFSEFPLAIEEVLAEEAYAGDENIVGEIIITPLRAINALLLKKASVANQPELFLKSVRISNRGMGQNALLYSFTGEDGTFKQYFDSSIPSDRIISGAKKLKSDKEIYERTGITLKDLNSIIGFKATDNFNPNVFSTKMSVKFNIPQFQVADTIQKPYAVSRGYAPDKVEYGMGIAKKQEPKLVPFGNVLISYTNLKYKNILTIKTHLGKTIGGLPNKKISAKLTSILLNLLERINPTHEELYRLSPEERHLYDRLVNLGRLHTELPNTNEKSVSELKKRLKLLEGEIEIGNNSPQIIQEIKHILKMLKEFNVITEKQRKEYENRNLK
jgi:hypothetical protein